jgi:hypothetical protein
MITKIYHWLSAATLATALVLVFLFAYLLFYPIKTVEFRPGSFQTSKTKYKNGEVLSYRLAYHKYTKLPGVVIPSFVDGIVFQLPAMQTNNPMGEHDFVKTSFVIPECLPPGNYTLQMTIIYKINAFRDITHYVRTNQFEVVGNGNVPG